MFQSLLGFLMRCDPTNEVGEIVICDVSIPAGFSDALRHKRGFILYGRIKFQSLLGFLMRCDVSEWRFKYVSHTVSIPAGFSDALRLEDEKRMEPSVAEFQSLLGFLMRCDQMPVYPGKGQCVASSRYMAFEAKEHNLTISTCIVGGSGSAQRTEKHQVCTFKDDGVRYYTANTRIGDQRILTAGELVAHLDSKYPGGMTHLSARDYWTP